MLQIYGWVAAAVAAAAAAAVVVSKSAFLPTTLFLVGRHDRLTTVSLFSSDVVQSDIPITHGVTEY